MSLRLEQVLTEGIAQLSYVIGDDSTGTAAVIDPRTDVSVYVEKAREFGLSITHIFETHIHADFVSGARELADRVGSATIYLSGAGGAKYGFKHKRLSDGDQFAFGKTVLTARHTPGHTPEHVSFVAAEKGKLDTPFAVFTGDSLFVSSAGRPDLLGDDKTEMLVKKLYHTLFDFYLKLNDDVIIYPGHGHGSPCGADIADRLASTIGYERRFNTFLQHKEFDDFRDWALSSAPPTPTYYPRMKKLNAVGPEVLGRLPIVAAMPPKQFNEAIKKGKSVIVDTRSMLAFGGAHIRGAINLGAKAELSLWAGWMINPAVPILLVLESDEKLEEVIALFIRTGFTKFGGYLVGGMGAWDNAGLPIQTLRQMSVQEVSKHAEVNRLDVRSPEEWEGGHMPSATHRFLPELRDKRKQPDKTRPLAVYCASGYRASLAASWLQAKGFKDVRNVPGSWQAWTSAGLPVEKNSAAKGAHK